MANPTFGERMRLSRIKNEWSQSELGEKLGVTQQAISNWENGRGVPDRNQMVRLRETLGIRQVESTSAHPNFSDKQAEIVQQADGERMRRGRIKNAWSQSELGAKLGVTQKTVSNWENGRGGPGPQPSDSFARNSWSPAI